MKILIDLQGAQTLGSRDRGVGRYSVALAKAIIRNRNNHEVHLALNGAFRDTISGIRAAFKGLIPDENIHVLEPIVPAYQVDPANRDRRLASEAYREIFLARLNPDVIHITSLFEGFGDDAICSIGGLHSNIPTTVTLYDLIPLLNPKPYLENPLFEKWYLDRIDHLRRADMCFAISESSRQEGINCLGFTPDSSVNIGTDADPQFQKTKIDAATEAKVRKTYGLRKAFVLYTGGIDHRKNVEGLIRAFAKLPSEIRKSHQLAIVCSVQDVDRARLLDLARQHGIHKNSLVITGFVPEEDLIALYGLCRLFVFPSWHEGFGLPALEAMRCGAPVIAANRSSLPEVVGLDEALFNPFDDQSICDAMAKGLADEKFRDRLLRHLKRQSQSFSWDEAGMRAVAAFEALVKNSPRNAKFKARPRLAYVSPLPPAKTGIADYSAELLPELARHYEIDLIVKDSLINEVDIALAGTSFGLISASHFRENWKRYDRILYHFGNSDNHDHMFDLLEETSGAVVLHDFFLSGIAAHREWHGLAPRSWAKELYRSHGYLGPVMRKTSPQESDAVWALPCSLSVLDTAHGVIVHSENGIRLAEKWYGNAISEKLSLIPLLRVAPSGGISRNTARDELGFENGHFVICSFGMVGPSKLNHKLLEAWDKSKLSKSASCQLFFVGQNDPGAYGDELQGAIDRKKRKSPVEITGWADQASFRTHLAAADLAVQLRTLSRGETSAAALDCMNYGVPLIANANGAMADLPQDATLLIADEFTVDDLKVALEQLYTDHKIREQMSKAGREKIIRDHAPRICADLYRDSIERSYARHEMLEQLTSKVAALSLSNEEMRQICLSIARALSTEVRRLFVDISELAFADAKTGIQRVVRNILWEMLNDLDPAFRVEPIYLDPEANQYRYARRFTSAFLGVDIGEIGDDIVDFAPLDILLLLDLNPSGLPEIKDQLDQLTAIGVRIVSVVYDLLPIKLPHCFPPEAEGMHKRWLDCIARGSKAVCISASVARDLEDYLAKNYSDNQLEIDYFPLGSELDNRNTSNKSNNNDLAEIGMDFNKPTFLMVGTIEPRKGHGEVLDAFEALWSKGQDVNLCIVGKQGWMVEELTARIERLSEKEPRLKWLSQISDAILWELYDKATCLLGASLDEGFGLPLVEGAQHGLPIIARDIPVFREVCGNGATYFGNNLEKTVLSWIDDYASGCHVPSTEVNITSWKKSTNLLLESVFK